MKNIKLLLSVAMIVVFGLRCSQKATEPTPPAKLQISLRAVQMSTRAPVSVYFDDIHSGGLEPYSWKWNFGDGGIATTEKPTHTYSDPGTFWARVDLISSDNQFATDSVQIQVGGPNALIATAIAVPPQGQIPFTTTLLGSADGGNIPYSFSWRRLNEATVLGNGPSLAFSLNVPGTFVFVLTVTSDDGQTAKDTVSVLASREPTKNMPPVLTMRVYQSNAIANQTAVYGSSIGSRDPDGKIISTLWNFGDGITSRSDSVSHIYHSAGLFRITCSVTDDSNAVVTDNRYVQVDTLLKTPNKPPVLLMSVAPTTGIVGQTQIYCSTAGSYDSDGVISDWVWSFGDGSYATGQTTSHVFSSKGLFMITATITDNLGARVSDQRYVLIDTVTIPKPHDTCWQDVSMCLTATPTNMRVSGKLKNPAGQFFIAVKVEITKPCPDLISGIVFPYLGKLQSEAIIDPNPGKTGTYQAIIVLGSQFFLNCNSDFDFTFQTGPQGSSIKLLGVYGCTDRGNLLSLKP